MDQELPVESETEESYDLSENTLLVAAVIVLAVVLLMACFHLYAHVLRLRRRNRARIMFYASSSNRLRPAVDRGLDLSILNSLPVFLFKLSAAAMPTPECAVCLSEFEEDDVVRLLPKCGHSFHVDCIGMWLHSHSTCPLCRSSIELVANRTGPATASANPASTSDSGSSLGTAQSDERNSETSSFWGRRKAIGAGLLGVRIEGRAAELDSESARSSSLLSLKRLLSVSRKPPVRANPTVGTSGGAVESDLESGLSESMRATRGVANSGGNAI